MLYQPQHHIVIVAAVSNGKHVIVLASSLVCCLLETAAVTLSKWRILDSAPHYAIVEGGELVKSSSFLSSFGQLLPYQPSSNYDVSQFNGRTVIIYVIIVMGV